MVRTHRLSTTGALVLCLMGTHLSGTLFASEEPPPIAAVQPVTVQPSRLVISDRIFDSIETEGAAQRGYRGRGNGRNGGAVAAIVIGAAASIAGGAVLVYANRPECSANGAATGCGYGSKVTGTAVLSAGIVSLIIGALSWR